MDTTDENPHYHIVQTGTCILLNWGKSERVRPEFERLKKFNGFYSANDPLADVFLTKFGKMPIDETAGVDYSAILKNDLKAKTVFIGPQDLPNLSHWGKTKLYNLSHIDLSESISQANYVYFSKESSLGIFSKGYSGSSKLSIPLHSKPFIEFSDQGQLCVISIQPRTKILNNEEESLDFPFIPELNHFYDTTSTFGIGRTRVEPDGLGIISEIIRSEISLNLVKVTDLVFKIFSLFKMSATLSQRGKVAKQLIKQMGGVQGCRPFKIEGVRKLIAKYKAHEPFTWGRQLI